MFKIPTYEEIEKKEADFNKERKEYTGSLFQKRKLFNSIEPIQTPIGLTSEAAFREDDANKKQKVSDPPVSQIEVDADDEANEDDLLNMFIQENKNLIEKPVEKVAEKTDFLVPVVPPLKAAPVRKPEILNSNPTTSTNSMGGGGGGGSLIVNSNQRGNLVLKHIRNVQWKFCDQITPDYQMSRLMCAYFLSMKYHLLNPTYLHKRVKELGRAYNLRVLLALVDVKEPRHCIKELEKISIFSNLTLILCWSNEEVARYLETFKAYEFKSAEAIMEKATQPTGGLNQQTGNAGLASEASFISSITDFYTGIKSVNKTDASILRQTFGSVKQLSLTSKDELNLCPGLGPLKINRIHEIFRIPFLINKK